MWDLPVSPAQDGQKFKAILGCREVLDKPGGIHKTWTGSQSQEGQSKALSLDLWVTECHSISVLHGEKSLQGRGQLRMEGMLLGGSEPGGLCLGSCTV